MKQTSILIFLIIFFVSSRSFGEDYICDNIKFADGSSDSIFILKIDGDKATTKNKYVSINWAEIPLGYKYKIFKMTSNSSQSLMIIAIQKDDPSILNYTNVSGDPYHVRNSVSWGNCPRLGN